MRCFLGSTVDYKKEKRWQRPTALGLGSPGTRKGTGVGGGFANKLPICLDPAWLTGAHE